MSLSPASQSAEEPWVGGGSFERVRLQPRRTSENRRNPMSGFSHNPVYNARIPLMPISPRAPRVACLLLLIFLHPGSALANDWQGPATQLAHKIAAVTGPGAVALNLVNRSSLGRTDEDDIRRHLMNELATLGVQQVSPDQAAFTVQVSLSEDLRDCLWVTEIRQGTNQPIVVMVSAPGKGGVAAERSPSLLTIHKALLWMSGNRILDVAVLNSNPPHMIVLEPERIALYRLQNSQWQEEQLLPIAHPHPWPRDMRGRLISRKDHLFDAYLPGVFCRSSASPPLAINCSVSDDPWPLTARSSELNAFFSATRNFFTGALSPGIGKQTTAPPFYSAAPLPRSKYTLWMFAAADGQIHFLDGMTDQTRHLAWGSDLAGVHSSCGSGWQVLATANGSGDTDQVTAFEILDREPVIASHPADFNGTITGLWADSEAASAIAVSRNAETGEYEAYRLSITCSQ